MRKTTLFVALLAGMPNCNASQLFEYTSNSVEVLRGTNYKLSDNEKKIFSFKHADSWRYGDNYFFLDTQLFKGNPYAEFSPRLSLTKISGHTIKMGFISDVLLAGTYEKSHSGHTRLYGVGFDIQIPHFSFSKLNLYHRDNENINENTWQATISWSLPFNIGNQNFKFDGFADIIGSAGSGYHTNQQAQPQFLWDLEHFVQQKHTMYAGVEYQYWHNKLGNKGVTESLPQLMIKFML